MKSCGPESGGKADRIFSICILLLFFCIRSSGQLIEGNLEKCYNEGEVVEIPFVTDNPCFTCLCKEGSIQCSREVCPSQYSCSHFIEQPGKCCRQCFDCTTKGMKYTHGQMWYETFPGEQRIENICKDGIITRQPLQCHATCENPIAPPANGLGCRICKGCVHEGADLMTGEIFSPSPCIQCTCHEGYSECRRKVCPVLVCEKHKQQLSGDGCCLKCQGEKLLFELNDGGCWFRRGYLENEEIIKIDKCTTCVCQNGTIVCDRQVCTGTLNCPEKDLIRDGCCPRCPTIRFQNCTDYYGNIVEHGETWRDSRDPCRYCSCHNGTMTCHHQVCPQRLICPKGEVVDKLPGSCCPACQSEPGICSVFGDPHYRTFDGRPFNFQGDCKYILTRDCLGKNFSVIVKNTAKKSSIYSWTDSVHLRIFGKGDDDDRRIVLFQRMAVKVNGRKVALPFISADVVIWVELQLVRVRTNAGISLNWDGDSFLEVGASSVYRGNLCGLCGNFNSFSRDDFIGRDGQFKFEKEEFANSWRVGSRRKNCSRKKIKQRSVDPCGSNIRLKVLARRNCQVFKSKPFRKCYTRVDPLDYYKACMTDVCECFRARKCSCESIRAYTSACFRQGVRLEWNEARHCKRPCSHGKVYTPCGSPCKLKCKNIYFGRRQKCKRACTAGCFCPAGFAVRGRKCVKISKCYSKRFHSRKISNYHHGNPLERYLKT